MVDPEAVEIVETSEMMRGVETDDGHIVILDESELATIQPEESREINVVHLLPDDAIPHQWFDRPYYLGPDEGKEDYFAFLAALQQEGRQALVRWVMRKKHYVGAIRPEGDYLMLITLRHAGEVIPVSSLAPPPGRDMSERELSMARQLVDAMAGEFDIGAFRDEYRDRVLELVEAKAAGKVVRLPKAKTKKESRSLEDVLARSVAAAAAAAAASGDEKRGRKSA
jgi:DNA end-binding protein Ku